MMVGFKIVGSLILLGTLHGVFSKRLFEEDVVCLEADSCIRHSECHLFYRCTDFEPILEECKPDNYFSPELELCSCVPEDEVLDCMDGTNSPMPTTQLTTTTTTSTPTTTTSTTTTPTTTITTSPTMTTTTTPEPSTTTLAPEEPTTEAPLCPPEGRHNFPHPGNCSLYIRCFDGEPLVLDCAPLVFDKNELLCKPDVDAACNEEDPVRCPTEGYQVHPHDSSCSKYYECYNGNLFELECSVNLYFDARQDLLRCNQAELAVCNSECPPSGYHYLPIRARNCKWYKVCIEGYSANLECGENEVFDPDLSQCVGVNDYSCPYTLFDE